MKILEELKREQAQRGMATQQVDRRNRPRSPASDAVHHGIEFLSSELSVFAKGLNQLKADVEVAYDVEGIGTLKGLVQRGYNVLAKEPNLPRFEFCFRCVGQLALNRVVTTVAERDQLQATLTQLGLTHQLDHSTTWRYTISVKPEVNVRLLFSPTASGDAIRMEARNLHRLGVELFSIQPAQVTEVLLDELGKLVLRRENRFAEMSGNTVSNEIRERLREQVKQRKQQQAELAEVVHKEIAEHHAGRKKLFRAADPAATAPRARPVPRQAPIMVSDEAPQEGWVNWDSSGEPALETGQVAAESPLLATQTARSAGTKERAATSQSPRYAWLITRDVKCADTAGTIARRGPSGSQRAFPLPVIMNTGRPFRLKTSDGEVRFLGNIAGEYIGDEPLSDFGRRHGCNVIEYQRGGEWVRVDAAD